MSESQAEQQSQQPQGGDAKTFDAEYVDKLRKENAKYRTEAKANSEAAQRLAQLEEASKTEAQKVADALAAAEKRAAELEAKAIRGEVSGETGVPAALLAGPEDGTAESVKAYAAALQAWATDKGTKPQQGLHIVNPGQRPGSEPDKDAMARTFFGV